MEISTTTETVTVNKYTLTLTEAELSAALVDPAPLQDALRSARGQAQAKPAGYGRNYGQRLTKSAGRKAKPASPKAEKSGTGPNICGACKRSFGTAHALKIHTVRSHKAGAAPVETA